MLVLAVDGLKLVSRKRRSCAGLCRRRSCAGLCRRVLTGSITLAAYYLFMVLFIPSRTVWHASDNFIPKLFFPSGTVWHASDNFIPKYLSKHLLQCKVSLSVVYVHGNIRKSDCEEDQYFRLKSYRWDCIDHFLYACQKVCKPSVDLSEDVHKQSHPIVVFVLLLYQKKIILKQGWLLAV